MELIWLTPLGLAKKLKDSGLNIVYLSFDSFHEEFNRKIRGRELLDMKLKAIDVCRTHDMEIILVNTLMKSLNDNEVGDMISFAAQKHRHRPRLNLPAYRLHWQSN